MGADRGNGRRQQYLYDLYLFLGIHSEKDLKDIEQCRQMDTERQQFQE
jgi:hypothetical protein